MSTPASADGRPADTSTAIRHGTPAFRRTNLALFAAGLATFGLLYCVQPLMPQFSHDYGVSAAASALSLSLTTGVLAFAMLFAGALSDAVGRKSVMAVSLLSSAVLVLATLFERHAYKPTLTDHPGPQWRPTGERFLDPTSGEAIDVYENPATSERRYVSRGGPGK